MWRLLRMIGIRTKAMILIGSLLLRSYKPSNKIWKECNKQEFDDVGINKRNMKWNFMEYRNSIEMQIFKNPNSFLSKIHTHARTHTWPAMRNELSKYDSEKIPDELTIGGIAVCTERAKASKARVKEEEDDDEECQQLTVLSLVWIWFADFFHSPLRKTGSSLRLSSTNWTATSFFFSVFLCGPFLDRLTGLLEYGPIGFCWGFGPFGDLLLLLDKQAWLHANFHFRAFTNLQLKPKNINFC